METMTSGQMHFSTDVYGVLQGQQYDDDRLLPSPTSTSQFANGYSYEQSWFGIHDWVHKYFDTPSGTAGANVVAIDNKIEQAMDLVKTHLMYAVREEIEVLKIKIQDMDRKMKLLEAENQILRKHAPAEILANLATLVGQETGNQPPSTQQQQ